MTPHYILEFHDLTSGAYEVFYQYYGGKFVIGYCVMNVQGVWHYETKHDVSTVLMENDLRQILEKISSLNKAKHGN